MVESAENDKLKHWSATVICSDEDRQILLGRARGADARVAPNAVAFPDEIAPPPQDGFNVLFVGSMDYPPNADGITWFCERVWPQVRKARPDARLDIVGRDPPAVIIGLEALGVKAWGRAAAVEPHYLSAHTVIAPIFSGGGTRIKIIEAMAQGRAVVTTTVGSEGLDFQNRGHGLIADTAEAFTAAVLDLAADPQMRATLAAAGRAHAAKRFSLNDVVDAEAGWLARLMDDVRSSAAAAP